MNYKDFNDYELLENVHSCNEDANEILLYKYRPLIVSEAKRIIKYSSGGVDLNDLIQEGLLGLSEAINTFREDKDTNFGTYAKLCVERKMYSVIKSTRTYKNKILNESISLEDDVDNLNDKYLADTKNNPFDMISEQEYEEQLLQKLNDKLTDFEKQVLELKKNDFDYKEIAEILDKDSKSIDNAIQRIKLKLKNIMNNKE